LDLRTLLIPACLLLAAAPAAGAPPFAGGPGADIRHLTVHTNLEPTAVDPDAEGWLRLMLRQQGGADIQKLQIWLENLEPETSYELVVFLRDVVDPVAVQSFDTEADGSVYLKLMRVGHAAGPGPIFPGGGGFPAPLDPLVDVLALEVQNGLGETVLSTELGDPDRFQVLVKRRLDNEGVDPDAAGRLFLKGKPGKTLFRLSAGNLDANTDYALALNGVEIATAGTDDRGRLEIKGLPDGAPAALEILRVELLDGADQAVLGTDLP
jgi:hypothetical protein